MKVLEYTKFFNLGRIQSIDPVLFFITLILSCVGGAMVFSTTYFFELGPSSFFFNHIAFSIFGIFLLLLLTSLNALKIFKPKYLLIYILVVLILLVLVMFIGTFAFEARRWIAIGSFTLQPSEFAKLAVVFASAMLVNNFFVLNKSNLKFGFLKLIFDNKLVASFLLICFFLSVISLVTMQKSLGNTVFIVIIFVGVILLNIRFTKQTGLLTIFSFVFAFISINPFNSIELTIGDEYFAFASLFILLCYFLYLTLLKGRSVFALVATVTLILAINAGPILDFSYNNLLQPFQRQRIESFFDTSPETNRTTNYNRQMATTAFSSGGVLGNGYLHGRLTNSGYLPFAYTDFAFASFGEQFGFVWTILLLTLYFLLLKRIYEIGTETNNLLFRNIVFGILIMLFLNIYQHVGMNIGILPITGVPLPFLSYGGSSLLLVFLGIGIVSCINIWNKEYIDV